MKRPEPIEKSTKDLLAIIACLVFGMFLAMCVCPLYVYYPVKTFFLLLAFSIASCIMMYSPWEEIKPTRDDIKAIWIIHLGVFAPAILCVIPFHFVCGIGHIDGLREPVDRVVISSTFSDDNISGSHITYTDRHMGTPAEISVEMPSGASLSSGATSFRPTAIIEYNGRLSGLANWISDQRKIAVEVTQGQKKFSAIIAVQDWSKFIEQAYTPEQEANEIAYQNQKRQKSDEMLNRNLAVGEPF